MASIRARNDRFEIRECRSTDRGPRQFTLARFRGVLTRDVLDEAAAQARRPFDPEAVVHAARGAGIPVSLTRRSEPARRLLAELQTGRPLDPVLVGLLREALAHKESRALPEHLEDAAAWVGRSEAERGKALRGLTRAASRVARGRSGVRPLPSQPFPRFSSQPDSDAA